MAPSGPEPLTPTALRKDGPDRLVIEWNDGHHSVYTWRHLRANCPCAGCREEKEKPADPFRILKPGELLPLAAGEHAARRPLRLQDRLERRPRHRHLHPGISAFALSMSAMSCNTKRAIMQPPGRPSQKFELPNIQYLVAVASGKGGVGKSTVAANLALALLKQGKRVGLMDADIYGPSVPIMLGIGDVDPADDAVPAREARPQAHVDGLPAGAGQGGHAARADGADATCSASSRRSTGANSTTCSSTCRPAPATPS